MAMYAEADRDLPPRRARLHVGGRRAFSTAREPSLARGPALCISGTWFLVATRPLVASLGRDRRRRRPAPWLATTPVVAHDDRWRRADEGGRGRRRDPVLRATSRSVALDERLRPRRRPRSSRPARATVADDGRVRCARRPTSMCATAAMVASDHRCRCRRRQGPSCATARIDVPNRGRRPEQRLRSSRPTTTVDARNDMPRGRQWRPPGDAERLPSAGGPCPSGHLPRDLRGRPVGFRRKKRGPLGLSFCGAFEGRAARAKNLASPRAEPPRSCPRPRRLPRRTIGARGRAPAVRPSRHGSL
jgi:hypothetical protein